MNRFVRAAAVAAVTSLASWVVTRRLERRAARSAQAARAIQTWENEGGNLAPQPGASAHARP